MFTRLSKYFSWKYQNSEKIDISQFVKIIWNIDIEWDFTSKYWSKFWSMKKDYEDLFEKIYKSQYWENKIKAIAKYFELSEWFIKY